MTEWGRAMYVTPGRRRRRQTASPPTSSTSTSASASCSAARTTTTGRTRRCSSTHDPLGNPVDRRHPWNQTTLPQPQKRDLDGGQYSWVMSPRWHDKRTGKHLAARHRRRAARAPVDDRAGQHGRPALRARPPGTSVEITLPKTGDSAEMQLEWKIPKWANTIERDRARAYFIAYAAAMALDFVEQALARLRGGRRAGLPGLRGARRRRSAAASTRRCAACSRITW